MDPTTPVATLTTGPAPRVRPRARVGVLGSVLRAIVAVHPISKVALIAVLARLVGLVRHYTGTDLLGLPIAPEPDRFLLWAVAFHAGLLLAFGGALRLFATALPRARRVVIGVAALVFAVAVLYGQIDLEVQRALGQRLTPGLIGQYLGPAMFTDTGAALEHDLGHFVVSGLLVLAAWVGLAVVWLRSRKAPARPARWRGALLTPLLGAALIAFPHVYRARPTRIRAVTPAEIIAARELVRGAATPAPDDPQAAVAALRLSQRPAPASARSLSDEHPLVTDNVRGAPNGTDLSTAAPRPDVFLVVVESLRGKELLPASVRPGPDAADPMTYPNLARFAAGAVRFPYFISNGFPSAQGFLALTCSAWPHPRAFVLSELGSERFDCLPRRLATLGYDTVYISGSNPQMDNQLPWVRRLYATSLYNDVQGHDRLLVDEALIWLAGRDAVEPDRPLFAWIATISTHYPFAPRDPLLGPPPDDDLAGRYRHALTYTDRELGRLLRALEARPREAVIVLVGDHAFPLDEPGGEGGEPCDRYVWTPAYIQVPVALSHRVGAPRTETFPASQIDIMPTILELVGDNRPSAALGRDLLDGDATGRRAIAVSHTGVRVDLADTTVLISLDGDAMWAERRRESSACAAELALTPELAAAAREALAAVETWAWLVDTNRVFAASLLEPDPRPGSARASAR